MKLFMHNSGSNPCGGPAFYAKATGAYNAYPSTKVSEIKMLNGEHPKAGEPLICGNCRNDFSMFEELSFIAHED